MPEGHTIHGLARVLNDAFEGTAPTSSSPQGRFAAGADLVNGAVLEQASAHGKHLFVEFEGDRVVNVHLGLIGKLTIVATDGVDPSTIPVRGQVRWRLVDRRHVADLRGAIICQVITPDEVTAIIDRLGPDPLRDDGDPDRAFAMIRRSGRSMAELLMDQKVLSGVGNVYRCEVLFRHRLNPATAGKSVKRKTWQAIWEDLREIMPIGLAAQQIYTMEDQLEKARAELVATGRIGRHRRKYYVYKRQNLACRVCGSTIRTRVVAGRNLFWCGNCQRRRS